MEDEKISFYMLGGDLVYESDTEKKFVARSEDLGFKFVFISPEAGRVSGAYSTRDFYPELNSILRVLDVDYVTYKLVDGNWVVELGDSILDPNLYYEEKNGTRTFLDTELGIGDEGHFILDLENYTLRKGNGMFLFRHNFSDKSVLDDIFNDPGIDFKSEEIMFRTFESRLSEDSEKFEIYTTRKPSMAMIGQIIRFTGDSDDGENLAIINGVDPEHHLIYIDRVDTIDYNLHEEGTWLRTYNDYSNGQVMPNEYPKIYLSPTFWTIEESELQSLIDTVANADPSGLLSGIDVELDTQDSFGYSLRDVSYSKNGLDFVGGMNGAFYIGFDFNFFGRGVDIDPVRIDYGSALTSLQDEILRINTYKSEAFRFYFNPDMFASYADYADMGSFNPPDTFPLKFRLYFDKEFELIGGNVRINLPGKGIPLPGGLIYIDNIGGGYRYPQTFEVGANFTSLDADFGFPLWSADVEMELSIDQKYLEIEGSSWMFGRKIQVGDFDAVVAWSYYTGKKFKGVEVFGEVGVHVSKVDLVMDLTFKVKRYKTDGSTRTYIGGRGRASIEAFGYTFGGVSVGANMKRFKASVEIPIIGQKSVYVYYEDVLRNISGLSSMENNVLGVASMYDEAGNLVVLVPEARLINQPITISQIGDISCIDNSLTLSNLIYEGAITVNYTGTLDSISVTLPDGTTKDVIIATDTTVYDPAYLYAMDYEISDTERQLYIQLTEPQTGDYTVNYGNTVVSDINLYEITQIPELTSDLNANIVDDIVTLNWDINEDIDQTKYHLTLVEVDDLGEIINEYPLYEDYTLDDLSVVENYMDDASIEMIGLNNTTNLLMPSNLHSGNYQFILEPIFDVYDGENLAGEAVKSNTFIYTTTNIVNVPTTPSITYLGSGINEVVLGYEDTLTSYDVLFMEEGIIVDSMTILNEDLVVGETLIDNEIIVSMTLENDTEADFYLESLLYDTEYQVLVIGNKEEVKTSGDYYDIINDYIVIENIFIDQNEGTLNYFNHSSEINYLTVLPTKIETELEVESQNLGEMNPEPVIQTEYVYDPEDDTVDIEILTYNQEPTIITINSLEDLTLIPNQEVSRFGMTIMKPDGSMLLELPEVDLSLLFDYSNYLSFMNALNSVSDQYSPEDINIIIDLYNSGAITLGDNFKLQIDIDQLIASGLMDSIEDGTYRIHVDLYNTNNDYTVINYDLNIENFVPDVFIESMIPNNGTYTVSGLSNGAFTLSIEGYDTVIEDGYFTVDIPITTQELDYTLVDFFGNTYTGTIVFSDDLNKPTITLSSTDDIEIEVGEDLVLPTCSAYDLEDGELTCQVEYLSTLNEQEGTYEVIYYAVDNYGNETERVTINVIVHPSSGITCNPGFELIGEECVPVDIPGTSNIYVIIGSIVGGISLVGVGFFVLKKFIL
jgi:hypothetical protein